MAINDKIIINSKYIMLNKRYFIFFYFLFISQFKEILLNYFENNYQVANISQNAAIIDITDYYDLYLLITTEKIIYTGMPPTQKSVTTSNIINITVAATYDTNYVLLACTGDYFLSKININTGEEVPLISYSDLSLSIINVNYTCSISILDNIVYIGIPQILENTKLTKNFFKIVLTNQNDNNGPILGNIQIKKYTLKDNLTNLGNLFYPRILSGEIISRINNLEDPRLVIGYLKYDTSKNLYRYTAIVLKADFSGGVIATQIISSSTLLPFRVQKINSTFIRFLTNKYTYEIYLNSSYMINIVKSDKRNLNLYKFPTGVNAFYYHNKHLFYGNPNGVSNYYLYMKSNISNSTIRFQEKNRIIHYCMGYYDEINDSLEMIYQYANIVKYFIVKNLNSLFYYTCEPKIIEVISNETIIYNVTQLMTYPLEHKLLTRAHSVHYPSTSENVWSFDNGKIHFNKNTQILNVTTDLNNWLIFHFYFFGGNLEENITIHFVIPTCLVKVRTCAFKCGSCSQDYNICDPGTCKKNFSMLRDSDDTDCYPNDQNMPNYIYNETTEYYEKCYSSCNFCSKQNTLSSNLNHNCKTCNDGYLKSYEYMGNCYSIDNLYNNSEIKKIVKLSPINNYLNIIF